MSDFEDDGEDESDGGWQQELQRRYEQEASFMAELRARHPSSPPELFSQADQNFDQNYGHGNVQMNFSTQDTDCRSHSNSITNSTMQVGMLNKY